MFQIKPFRRVISLLITITPIANGANISLNPSITYQTIDRWEGDIQMGQGSPYFDLYKDALVDRVVNEMGITRVRLGIGSGVENTRDFHLEFEQGKITKDQERCLRFSTVNDNADPNVTNPNGFIWRSFDLAIDKGVVPLRAKLASKGEKLYVNLTYIAFTELLLGSACGGMGLTTHHTDPAEYAEFILATFQHMQSKYGFVPDSLEMYLEPDNVGYPIRWDGTQIAKTLLATRQRLITAGFIDAAAGKKVDFIAPSTTDMANTVPYFDQMVAYNSAHQYVNEISYHRYFDRAVTTLQAIASRAKTYNKKTSMLEYGGADFRDLHADLKYGLISSWEQYTLGYGTCSEFPVYGCFSALPADNGYQYYLIDDAPAPHTNLVLTHKARGLRQYMKYIRPGARRIAATSSNSNVDPLTFINPDGTYVVVIKNEWAVENSSISGLPAGTYGITYVQIADTGAHSQQVQLQDQTIASGGVVNIPAVATSHASVTTIYGKSGGAPPPNPCDLNGDGNVTSADVQLCVDQVSGKTGCSSCNINGDFICDVVDLQRVTNAALPSGTCVTAP